ncbi:cytochrome P450 [Halorussus salinisoli]|uniref:cytochrome P450 n=1 Tax=Halorussus salinisoli TaxID=2558242 RepID=UPI0010C2347D|nr:cytochrome P450 [Halorussus salinisoli]
MADRQPRGPTGIPVFGSSLDFAADPLGFMEECAREYGDFARIDTLNREVYLLTDPEGIEYVLTENYGNYRKPDLDGEGLDGLLGDGLLTSEGDLWRSQRKRIQPAFFREQLDRYAETMVGDARELAETWSVGDRIEGDSAMSQLTLRIIVETVLGAELGGMEREISEALIDVSGRFRSDDVRSLVPADVPTPRNVKYRRGERRLERVVRDIVRQHERGERTEDGGDMLSLLLRARDAGAVEIDDEQIRDEVLTMLLAGHDTTALTLTYSWYLLSENQEARRRFHAELDAVVGDSDPTVEDVQRLDYTERVVKEAMRLYPPAYTIYREANADDSVTGFHLPEGAIVSMPQWVVHRDPRWWDDPDGFRPERWSDEARDDASRPDYAYYPFGGGPRRCIGEEFATREAKFVLATIGRRFELEYAGRDEPELIPMVTLHPEPPVEFDVKAR